MAGKSWWDLGRHAKKKWFSRGGHAKKNLGERRSREIFYSNTLKWHIVSISEALDLKRKKRAEEKAKESREAKDKSYKDYPWTELCKDVTKLKKLRVPELNNYFNHHGLKQHLRSNKSEKVKSIVRH